MDLTLQTTIMVAERQHRNSMCLYFILSHRDDKLYKYVFRTYGDKTKWDYEQMIRVIRVKLRSNVSTTSQHHC